MSDFAETVERKALEYRAWELVLEAERGEFGRT